MCVWETGSSEVDEVVDGGMGDSETGNLCIRWTLIPTPTLRFPFGRNPSTPDVSLRPKTYASRKHLRWVVCLV